MPTVKLRASTILGAFEHAQTELVGKAVILSDGKAGTVPPDRTHGRPAAAGLASQPIRYTRGTRSQGAVLKYPA